jgi:hypothetical protein
MYCCTCDSDRADLGFRKIGPQISCGDLPHVVELDMPRSRGAAQAYLAYDEFKACGMKPDKNTHEVHNP